MGGKLPHSPHHLSRKLWDLLNAPPIVGLHGEILAKEHSHFNSNPVAAKDVQDPMVPPAFTKVGELELEGVLHHFEHD